MSAHEPSHAPAGIPLQALVAELRSRCEAVSRLQGGSTYFHEELGIFRLFVEEQNLFLQAPPDELSRVPDEEGNEHQIWYRPESKAVLKATWPDFFGLLVIHRPNEEHKASPIAYLERWCLHNELFGDDVRFPSSPLSHRKSATVIDAPLQAQAGRARPAAVRPLVASGVNWE